MAEPPSFAEIKARLATLRAEREAASGGVSPPAAPTPEQLGAMRETMGILSDPEMLARVAKSRRAVASADVVSLEELWDAYRTTPGEWRVMLAGPVARELTASSGLSDTALRELLDTLVAGPAQGQPLGFGLAGMRALQAERHRVLYAIDDGRRVVTILSVDQPSR
jgi:mRNA-degrading endonuclease RelE of RelBE toxin-antitoxin system